MLGVSAILAAVAAALAAWWFREQRRRPRRRESHALTPGGSLRLGAALAAVAGACALACGTAVSAAHARDPAVVLMRGGATRLTATLELLEDPAPSLSRWSDGVRVAEVRVLDVARPGSGRQIAPAGGGEDDGPGAGGGSGPPPRRSAARMLAQGRGWEHLARGDVVRVSARADASFHADPPDAGTLRADDPQLVARPGGWKGMVRVVRASLTEAVRGTSDQARALVPGMAVGDDREMTRELRDDMRTSSLTHLTAVSGSHVAILLGVVVWVVPGRGWGRAAASAGVMAILVAVVGPEPSVVRSVATAGVGVTGLLTRRPGQAQAGLCAVAGVILLLDPWSARSFGFALSVLATWGVIGPATAWTRWTRTALREDTVPGRAARRLAGVGAVPVAAQLLVAPVLLLLNPWLPTWGVVANIVAAPAVAPASLLGLAAAGTAPWWPGGGRALATGAGLFTGWIAGVGRMVSGWPLARLPWPDGVGGAAALVALGMLAVAGGRWAKRRRDTRGLRRPGGSGGREG
jgi:competence protein ComEC